MDLVGGKHHLSDIILSDCHSFQCMPQSTHCEQVKLSASACGLSSSFLFVQINIHKLSPYSPQVPSLMPLLSPISCPVSCPVSCPSLVPHLTCLSPLLQMNKPNGVKLSMQATVSSVLLPHATHCKSIGFRCIVCHQGKYYVNLTIEHTLIRRRICGQ